MNTQERPAGAVPIRQTVRPVAWTLRSELAAQETTYRAHLWFSDPQSHAWAPLYDQAALDAAVAAERERCAKLIEPENGESDWTDLAQYAAYLAKRIRTEA